LRVYFRGDGSSSQEQKNCVLLTAAPAVYTKIPDNVLIGYNAAKIAG
jgi:hypothetical protein